MIQLKKSLFKSLHLSIVIAVMILLINCEGKDRFYRPNMPEKLCSIGIIDADDTVRDISFEKSYQSEYPHEMNDSLRGLNFSISSGGRVLFYFKNDSTIKNLRNFKIPDTIDFTSDQIYYLSAYENSINMISADAIVPEQPTVPTLISCDKEIINLSEPKECSNLTTKKSIVISFTFENNNENVKYFAILVVGSGFSFSSSNVPSYSGFLDFSVSNCNTPGFLAVMHGITMYHKVCNNGGTEKSPVYAYFIEGSKFPENKCNITLSTQFQDSYAIYDALKSIRIKLLSIPEPLYLFEKSLYTYKQTYVDPFTEPIYLNGNIKGGNGVFAICRSSELSLKFSPFF